MDKAEGILRQASEDFIVSGKEGCHYPEILIKHLLEALLPSGADIGFYTYPESVGWLGWITVGDCTIHFSSSDVCKLCGDDRSTGVL